MGSSLCGWCIDGFHAKCKKEIKHYDTVWTCGCEECSVNEATL